MIRQIKRDEVKLASDLADLIYPSELYESLESFENKFLNYPEGFLALIVKNEFGGYIIGHPWKGQELVSLDYRGRLPENPDVFYIHDVAVSDEHRGRGYGKELMREILHVGQRKGFEKFMLVAVNSLSRNLCSSLGFREIENVDYNTVSSVKMIREINQSTI